MEPFEFDQEDLQVFDEGQREVLLKIQNQIGDHIEDRVADATKDESEDSLVDDLDPNAKAFATDKSKLDKATKLWKDNGAIPGRKDRVTYEELCAIDRKHTAEMKDFTSTDHPLLIPRVVGEIVKEAIEPNIVLTPLLQRINYSHGTQLTFPAVGALTAADIPEGGEYPERSLDLAGQVVAIIGKSGVAVKFTEETIRYSLFDVMSMHLRAAGRALVRWKERKVADLIVDNAGGSNTLFDNTVTAHPSTTGRDAGGTYNGTLTLDDLFSAYATMVNRGFTPNTLIMNPFAWQIFADEAMQRAFGFQNASQMWQVLQGGLGNAPQWSNGNFGNGLLQNTTVSSPQQLATTFTTVPGIFPYPFRIIVSPYMPYDASINTTDMVMCDVAELGVLVVDEEVMTESWDDPARDIMKVKLRERYGLGSMNSGEGTGLLKGISINRGFDFSNRMRTNVDLTGLGDHLSGDEDHSGVVGQS